MMAAASDPQLIERALANEPKARRQVVEQLGPSLWTLCCRLDPDPEDAYQAVWMHLWLVLDRFSPSGTASLRTWACLVARRKLIDRHRRRQVHGEVVSLEAIPPVEPGLDARIAARQREARLKAAISRLPMAQREVVVLHHLHGVELDQIAVDLQRPVGTIKSRLHRGRAQLLRWLKEDGCPS